MRYLQTAFVFSLSAITSHPVPNGGVLERPPSAEARGHIDVEPVKCIAAEPSREIRLAFADVSAFDFVTAVSKILCQNFSVDRRAAERAIHVAAPAQISVADLWSTFLSVLSANQLTAVDMGSVTAIVPATEATRWPLAVYGPDVEVPPLERVITKIVLVKTGQDINALANFLNIYKSPQGQIHGYAPSKTLVITDYTSSVRRLERLVEALD